MVMTRKIAIMKRLPGKGKPNMSIKRMSNSSASDSPIVYPLEKRGTLPPLQTARREGSCSSRFILSIVLFRAIFFYSRKNDSKFSTHLPYDTYTEVPTYKYRSYTAVGGRIT